MNLQLRIIVLVAVFAILLIAGFCIIQVFNQLNVLNEHNTYRVRVGSNSAKTSLEFTLAVEQAQRPKEDPLPALKKELERIQQGGFFDSGVLLNAEGVLLAGSESVADPYAEDSRWAPYAATTYTKEQWYYAFLNTKSANKAVYAFIPILQNQKPRYILRLTYNLANIQQAMNNVYKPAAVMAGVVIFFSSLLVWLLAVAILKPIRILNDAARDIAAGNLSLKVPVPPTGDELEELASTFNEMTDALVRMKAKAENANPLTKLPGNNVIREEIERRVKNKTPFVAVYSDLDNFKAFNDKYGIGAGDEAIKISAKVMKESLKLGSKGDFLGHEGGDDFVLLTTPEKADAVTQYICKEFDQRIRALYSPEDLTRGTIVSKDREGNVKEFPIMTISLAGATNAHRPISSYAEVTNICAEVKKRAKRSSQESRKSMFVLDRRRGDQAPGAPGSKPELPGAGGRDAQPPAAA